MLKDITVGQFYPGNSSVHRLDPRFKILIMLFYIITIFFINSYLPYIAVVLFLLLIVKVADIPVKIVVKGLRPLRWILIITFVINLLFIPGDVIVKFGFLKITNEGLSTAIKMAIRLVLLVVGTSMLTLTTSPIAMTDGIEEILKCFKKFGMPAHEIAMMMTIALRFIPTLIEETDKIMKAQMARGADFESGNLMNRAKNLVPLLVPLFINAFRRADDLATAMEARCYRGGEGRTKFRELKFTKDDYKIFIGSMIFFVIIIVWRYI